MTTVAGIIDRSMRLLSLTAPGESPTTQEYADALVSLNAMIDMWRNDGLMVYATQEESLTLTGAANYTIGPSGDLNTLRPVAILNAYVRDGSYDYPVRIVDALEWASITAKSTGSTIPTVAFFDMTMPTVTVYLYPVPTGNTLRITTRVVATPFTATSDSVAFPPGYEEALATNLAVAIAPEYEVMPSPIVGSMAAASLKAIKKTNSRPITSYRDVYQLTNRPHSNIVTGQP